MRDTALVRLIDDPAALAEAAQIWRRIRARRLVAVADLPGADDGVCIPQSTLSAA